MPQDQKGQQCKWSLIDDHFNIFWAPFPENSMSSSVIQIVQNLLLTLRVVIFLFLVVSDSQTLFSSHLWRFTLPNTLLQAATEYENVFIVYPWYILVGVNDVKHEFQLSVLWKLNVFAYFCTCAGDSLTSMFYSMTMTVVVIGSVVHCWQVEVGFKLEWWRVLLVELVIWLEVV